MKKILLVLVCIVIVRIQSQIKTANPIIFVTQTPVAGFSSVTQTFNNHVPSINSAPRGGDLMIRYGDGTLRNLTREAGYGDSTILQGAKSIAVRQPSVHWSGTKALFSMVIGSPVKIWETTPFYWQIYEVTGLGKGETAMITKIPNQPQNYNNISPVYGSDGRIIFTSDMAFNKQPHLYPQLDEYENAKVVSGLWSLDPVSGDVKLLQHSPSGSFYPIVDSYGRIIFTRWDHLQRDQQADLDRKGETYGTFNWSSEDVSATALNSRAEVFPEVRDKIDPGYDSTISLHTFNQFFPWEINQDGSEEETVNHIGRHELGGAYTEGSFKNDPNLNYVIRQSYVANKFALSGDGGLFQIQEDPNNPGTYYAANGREFSRESAGQIVKFTGAPGLNPEQMIFTEITHAATAFTAEDGQPQPTNHSGLYRNPLPLTDGKLIVSHTNSFFVNKDSGSLSAPKVRYNFRLKTVKSVTIGGKEYFVSDQQLTGGIVRTLSYYDGANYLVNRTDTLWELDAAEIRTRPAPPLTKEVPPQLPEQQVMNEENIDEAQLRAWMKQNNLALIVSRNVTTRDRNDVSQPFNLKVTGGTQTVGKVGKTYDVKYMQLLQGDMLRGQGGSTTPRAGRRVLAQPMHDTNVKNPATTGTTGSVKLGLDGSMAAFVPARRAMTWQLIDSANTPIVRERYWVTFQPGEIRTCASCHGVNQKDQIGNPAPQNKPEALRALLQYWKKNLTSMREHNTTISSFALEQNFPNPFNPSTTIAYQLPVSSYVSLKVYDAIGREVKTLVNERKDAGEYSVVFDALTLSSGIYFAKLQSGNNTMLKKMILLR